MASASLLTGLKAWWTLDEESGERADSHGSNNLTDNATVLYGTGKQGNAADFEATNQEYLSIADNADLSLANSDFTFVCWIKWETLTDQTIASKMSGTGADQREWRVFYDHAPDPTIKAYVCEQDGSIAANASWTPNPAAGTWYFLAVYYDATTDTISIDVDNSGSPATGSHDGGITIADTAVGFQLSSWGGGSRPFDGLMDEAAFWKRKLTAGELTELYAGGDGITYTDIGVSFIPTATTIF